MRRFQSKMVEIGETTYTALRGRLGFGYMIIRSMVMKVK